MAFYTTGSVCEHDYSVDGYCRNRKTMSKQLTAAVSLVDTQWLRAASYAMNLSDQMSDYVLNDVGIVLADFPNRKSQAFLLKELLRFDAETLGTQVYMGFRGKPTFLEHVNEDPKNAKGLILDTRMIYIPRYDVWKIHCLCGWDKTKDLAVASAIANNELRTFSMGAWVENYICSVCGAIDPVEGARCVHMLNLGKAFGKKLSFQVTSGVLFFELSAVSAPADPSAFGELLPQN